MPRFRQLIDNWIEYLVQCPFPGGCFITSASAELGSRPGSLRDQLLQAVTARRSFLVAEIKASRPRQPQARAEEIATTLIGISMAANQELQFLHDSGAAERARHAMRGRSRHRGDGPSSRRCQRPNATWRQLPAC